ncbi:MAG: hypothetical protein AABZ12_08365 [Planctomycetota bacterium]
MPDVNTREDSLRLKMATSPFAELRLLFAIGTVPGVIFGECGRRNGVGKGSLRYGAQEKALRWKAPGSGVYGAAAVVGNGGTFLLEDGADTDKYVRVTVQAAYLPASDAETAVFLLDDPSLGPRMFLDVPKEEALAGVTNVIPVTLSNVGRSVMTNLAAWMDPATRFLSISGNDTTYVAPTDEASALALGTLAVGAERAFYVKQIIPAGTLYTPREIAGLQFRFDALG